MPLLILHPVPPLPPLPTYFALTLLSLVWSVLQAREDISVFEQSGISVMSPVDVDPSLQTLNLTHLFDIQEEDNVILKYVKTMAHDSWSVLVLCNVAVCFLIIVGMALQWLIFGNLRDIERQHVRDKLWNFAFYKFIVVFGVLNVQTLDEMIFWVAWFATFAFFHAFAQLSKDRFEYLSFSPATTNATHAKVLGLLAIIFAVTSILGGGLCLYVGHSHGWNLFLFMISECILLALRSLHVLLKYGIHLYDLHCEGVWEKRGMIVYYTELLMELLVLGVDLLHHIHMLLWGNVFLSMASLVICLQIRFLYNEIQRRVQRHRNYRKVVHNMETRFSNASQEELQENDDDCAICWEEMKSARKLPCNHLFHDGCLRSWLEHETSCPTCRHPLNITRTEADIRRQQQQAPPPRTPRPPGLPPMAVRVNRRGGHFFHFDGSMIASWMPSFSVEVTHANNAMRRIQIANRNSQLNNMANQVVQMFPHVSHQMAINDLRITRSVELTVENILEGRLHMENNGPQVSPTSSNEETSGPNYPVSPNVEENSYSPLLRPPDSSGTTTLGSSTIEDHSATSSTWHQVTEGGDTSSINNTPNSDVPSQKEEANSDVPSRKEETEEGRVATHNYTSSATRFSKSSIERQNMLTMRKERLLQEARRKYAEGQHESQADIPGSSQGAVNLPPDGSQHVKRENISYENTYSRTEANVGQLPENELVRRRNAVLAATLRRLNQHS